MTEWSGFKGDLRDFGEGGGFIVGRHSDKADPKKGIQSSISYPGLSEKGVEMAHDRGIKILELLKESKPGTVFFLAGTTEQERTSSTLKAYSDELANLIQEENISDIKIIRKSDIDEISEKMAKDNVLRAHSTLGETARLINNPDSKYIIAYPLFIFGFSMRVNKQTQLEAKKSGLGDPGWILPTDEYTKFAKVLLEKNNDNDEAAFKEWLANQGVMEIDGETIMGPKPELIAKQQIRELQRLGKFAKSYLPNHPIVIGSIGQSWHLDALAIYLLNDGRVDLDGFEKVSLMMEMGELLSVKVDGEKAYIEYGNREIKEIDLNMAN